MAYAMSRLLLVFLCMALGVVHVNSARLLLQAGKDPVGMTAEAIATTDDFSAQEAPASDSAEDAIVYNKDTVTTDETTGEFAAQEFDLAKRDSTEEFVYGRSLVPPTDVSFAQEDFTASSAAGTDRFSGSDATKESFDSVDQVPTLGADSQRTLGSDSKASFASADEGILVGDTQGTVGSGNYDYRYDAKKRDAAYPTDSNEGAPEFTLAEANPQLGSGESGNPRTTEEPQLFEFEDQDNMP